MAGNLRELKTRRSYVAEDAAVALEGYAVEARAGKLNGICIIVQRIDETVTNWVGDDKVALLGGVELAKASLIANLRGEANK